MIEVPKKRFWNSHRHLLGIVLVLSLGLKAAILLSPAGDGAINRDGVLYISAAKMLQEGRVQESLKIYPMPLYPAAIALTEWMVGDWILSARILSVLSFTLVCFPLFFLTRQLFNDQSAFWACLLFAVSPQPNGLTLQVIRDPVFLLFFAGAVYFGVRSLATRRMSHTLWTIVFSWSAAILRVEALGLIAIHGVLLLYLAIRKREDRPFGLKGLTAWLASVLVLIVLALSLAGADVRSFNRFGETHERISGWANWEFLESYEGLRRELFEMEARSPVSFARQNFAQIARHFIWLIYLIGLVENLIVVLTPAGALSLFWGKRGRRDKAFFFVGALTFCLLIALYLHLVEMDFLEPRFLLPVAILLLPWCGNGIANLVAKWKTGSTGHKALAVLLGILFVPSLYGDYKTFRVKEEAIQEVGAWLSGYLANKHSDILTTDLRIPFYAGMRIYDDDRGKVVLFRKTDGDYRDVSALASRWGIDTMIIDTSVKKMDLIPPEGLFVVVKEFSTDRRVVVVFKRK